MAYKSPPDFVMQRFEVMGSEVWDKSKLEIGLTMEFRKYHMMVNKSRLKFVNYQFKNHSLVISDGLIGIATFLFVVRRFGLSNV